MRETVSGSMLITLYELVEFGIKIRPHWKRDPNREVYFVPFEEMKECMIEARLEQLKQKVGPQSSVTE